MSRKSTVTVELDPTRALPATSRQKAALAALARKTDDDIDFSDIPPVGRRFWSKAKPGAFYRPLKQQITLRLDSDVVAWFKAGDRNAKGYQTRINRALRAFVVAAEKKAVRRKSA